MSLGFRLPLVPAVVAALVGGLLASPPAGTAAPTTGPTASPTAASRASGASQAEIAKREQAAAKDGLTRSEATFKKSAYLCYGYKACKQAGMGHAGYASANDKMYWRMYAGHNCTNYAAYRMVKSGMPNVRPWTGGGNATYWGTSVPKLTDQKPNVGAIAWWRANVGPAGSAGHVAYVEQVVSADEIIVSQDSWNGDFSWARITRASGNWPSGFIHFNDLQMANTAPPVVSGVAQVGTKLTATAGSWKPAPSTVAYQWYANGKAISGATKPSVPLRKGRLGQVITVRTTVATSGYPRTTATSAPTTAVAPGTIANTAAPALKGTAQVKGTLSLKPGSWSPAPKGLSYSWYADGQPIAGSTGKKLKLGPKMAGRAITAVVAASRAGYATATTSTPAATVAPGTIRVRRQPAIKGKMRLGKTLTVDTGAYLPAKAAPSVQWLRDGQPVPGATRTTYRLTAADLGARISANVTAGRRGFAATSQTVRKGGAVRVRPRLKVERVTGRHAVRLVIRVAAKRVPVVPGVVKVRAKGGPWQRVELRNGVARVVLTGLPQGKRVVRIAYTGSPTVTKLVRNVVVRMPARKR